MKIIRFVLNHSKVISFVLVLAALVHQVWGKMKWQYYPLYLVGALYFVLVVADYFVEFNLTPKVSRWVIGTSIFLVLLSLFSVKAFKKEEMMEPTGAFAIGTQTFEVMDETRLEEYTEVEGDFRKIKYQVWYPTDQTEHLEKAKWLGEGTTVTRQLIRNMLLPMPTFILDQSATIDSNSYLEAPVSPAFDKYPVVLISHGWKSFRELHTDFAEELASHGFIAISIDHTYGSQAVKFDDGKIAYINKDALPRITKPSLFSQAAHKLAVNYGDDVGMVLDDIERLNNEDEDFRGKIDLDEVGVLGHSTGGAGDVYIGLRDERIKALMGLDAWVNPLDLAELEKGLRMPSLFLRSEQWEKRESPKPLDVLVRHSDNARIIEMDETKHLDFPMIYMFSPYTKTVGLTGQLGGREGSKIQREIILNFFQQHLQKKEYDPNYLEDYLKPYDHLRLDDVK